MLKLFTMTIQTGLQQQINAIKTDYESHAEFADDVETIVEGYDY